MLFIVVGIIVAAFWSLVFFGLVTTVLGFLLIGSVLWILKMLLEQSNS